ncbi:Tryptophan--tRNA ligase [Candidatus Deianiraea vastatrix]|uniref:tryptophan--tRNA ligase n=1 Tax=Candidatus Deianiraea vastatrix TaxID=2163644 RepID=A0A5B8XDV2_9RICK|nr:tryptophan--tRNA ligase [Candidatus Deianiraea vastatrix]QED23410.1 Tryptophan--tRNA ligase [Candidatus Deianiraea vastatrix]
MSKTVISGMQPSGILHLGNYIGAILNWKSVIAKNPDWDYYFMAVDLHSLTSLKDGEKLRSNIIDAAICYCASGIDFSRDNISIFQQSKNKNHAELGWILQTITPIGWLERMTQFKDKKAMINTKLLGISKAMQSLQRECEDYITSRLEEVFDIRSNTAKIRANIGEIVQSNTYQFSDLFRTAEEIFAEKLGISDFNQQKHGDFMREIAKHCSEKAREYKMLDFEKQQEQSASSENINTGLFTYPALMAADILLYDADFVPVGDDQKQHIEFTRDIANRFNNLYANGAKKSDIMGKIAQQIRGNADGENCLKLPEAIIMEGSRIMSLTDGTKKMSKSDPSDASRILLTDTNDEIAKKISRAKTDSIRGVYYDIENRPDISNLIQILASTTKKSREEIEIDCKDFTTKQFKDTITDALISEISPIRENIEKMRQDKGEIVKILQKGVKKSIEKSEIVMEKVRKLVGVD